MDKVELKWCIVTTLTRRGKGELPSPVRAVTEVWDAMTGTKIAENDPYAPTYNFLNGKYEIEED